MNILNKYQKILIYDESTVSGGISAILNNIFLKMKLNNKSFIHLTCPEKQIFKYCQNRSEILKILNIDEIALKKKIDNLLIN